MLPSDASLTGCVFASTSIMSRIPPIKRIDLFFIELLLIITHICISKIENRLTVSALPLKKIFDTNHAFKKMDLGKRK